MLRKMLFVNKLTAAENVTNFKINILLIIKKSSVYAVSEGVSLQNHYKSIKNGVKKFDK